MFWSRWQKRQRWRNRRVGVVVSLLYVSLLGGSRTKAQSPRDTQLQTFTLEEAAAFALKNYPAVCASLERVRAAEAGVGVARTTEATFVVRIRNGSPEWVNVRTGEDDGKLVEVFGDVREGDEVAVRGTDELRPGTHVNTQVATVAK